MSSVKKNYLYETIYQILILIIPFLVSPYVSRVLKAEGVGVYTYTHAIVAYFVMFATLGIRNYGSRMIARCDSKIEKSKLFWSIFSTHMILSIFAVAIYIGYVILGAKYQIIACVQGLNILAAVLDISWFFSGMENFKILVVRNAIVRILTCVAVFLFVKSENDLIYYVLIFSLSSLLSAVILIPCAKNYICWVKPEWREVKEHFKPIFVLAIPTFLTTIYCSMDKILLGVLADNKEVAFYENSEKMVIVRNFIYSVGTVMLPRISSLYAKKEFVKIKEYIKQSTEFSLIMAYAFSFGLMACAKEFAPTFWGEEFSVCGVLINYVAIMIIINTVANTIRTLYLIPLNRDKEYINSSAIGAVSNVLLDILLIPFFQATGAWIATLLSSFCVCVYQMWIVRKELPMFKYCLHTKYYFFLGVGMLVMCRWAGSLVSGNLLKLVVEVLIGALIYTIGCYIYWKKNNKEFYLNMLKKIKI